ncbi:MAG: sugar-binding transcriptional regulator [bacterium]
MKDWEYIHNVSKVALLYYIERKTQEEIAKKLGLSRPTVSRFLSYARDSGIVSIKLELPGQVFPQLEDELEKLFSLEEVVVVSSGESDTSLKQNLGIGGAALLRRRIQGIKVLGVSWGSTLYEVINSLPQEHSPSELKVVQLVGGMNPVNSSIYADELAKILATKFNGDAYILRAPMVVDNPEIRKLILNESHIKEVLSLARSSELALVGIGALGKDSILFRSGCVSEAELIEIEKRGGVGDILGRFYDIDGRMIPSSLDERIIGLGLEDLKNIPYVIGVAGGNNKTNAILGALRMNILKGLVVDELVAREILQVGGNL